VIILGLSINSKIISSCLFIDDEFVALESEQNDRLASSSVKLPIDSIKKCLKIGSINFKDIDRIIISDHFNQNFKKSYDFFLAIKCQNLKRKAYNIFFNQRQRLSISKKLQTTFLKDYNKPKFDLIHICPYESINYYIFCASGFDSSAFLNINTNFNYFAHEYGVISGNKIKSIERLNLTNSLTYLYKTFAFYMGLDELESMFLKISKEATPIHQNTIWEFLIKIDKYNYILNPKYFIINPDKMIAEYIGEEDVSVFINEVNFRELLGNGRIRNTILTSDDINLIASFSEVYKEVVYSLLRNIFEKTGNKSICLNTDFHGLIDENAIIENTSFENVYIENHQNMQENIPMGAIMMHL